MPKKRMTSADWIHALADDDRLGARISEAMKAQERLEKLENLAIVAKSETYERVVMQRDAYLGHVGALVKEMAACIEGGDDQDVKLKRVVASYRDLLERVAKDESDVLGRRCCICGELDPGDNFCSCSCCGQEICDDCKERHDGETYCPNCCQFLRRCDNCAHWMGRDRCHGVCGHPERDDSDRIMYHLNACDDWERLTPDSYRDTIRRIVPLVSDVTYTLRRQCDAWRDGPGNPECKAGDDRSGCVQWELCRRMQKMREEEKCRR